MKGDFSRLDFDRGTRFSRVLAQQGRVTLDSDFNANTAILLNHLRTLTRDLFGPAGGPAAGNGFALFIDRTVKPARLAIGSGHYYVDGILCEVGDGVDYANQPDYVPPPPDAAGNGGDALLAWLGQAGNTGQQPGNTTQPGANGQPGNARFFLYLDVWERHVSWIEDDSLLEPALGGADTTSRVAVVWQVKALPWSDGWNTNFNPDDGSNSAPCTVPLGDLVALGNSQLAVRLDPGAVPVDACIIAPGARYRGAENQLYRIEIHQGGDASTATFKWSRDNGSVAARWLGTDSSDNLTALVVEPARNFSAGDWVELSYDALDLAGLPGELAQIASVEGDRLSLIDPAATAWATTLGHPSVRCWDQKTNDLVVLRGGAVPVVEGTATDPGWIDLGEGIQIRFAPGGTYRSGDYWTVRASNATGLIDWPGDATGQAQLLPPQGIEHHYAALGVLHDGQMIDSCRTCARLQTVDCDVAVATFRPPPKEFLAPRDATAAAKTRKK